MAASSQRLLRLSTAPAGEVDGDGGAGGCSGPARGRGCCPDVDTGMRPAGMGCTRVRAEDGPGGLRGTLRAGNGGVWGAQGRGSCALPGGLLCTAWRGVGWTVWVD